VLGKWGYQVDARVDGDDAFASLSAVEGPRLALLDWMMPGMDGYEVCSRLRGEKHLESLYVMIVTGNRQREDILRVIVVGADDYLIKPFEPVDLKIRIRNAMRVLGLQEEIRSLKQLLPA